jgi:hypothetical protein
LVLAGGGARNHRRGGGGGGWRKRRKWMRGATSNPSVRFYTAFGGRIGLVPHRAMQTGFAGHFLVQNRKK